MTNIFRFLEERKIAYAVVRGVYDKVPLIEEDVGFREDLDIVLDCNKEDIFSFIKEDNNFQYLENNSFLSVSDNLRIDLYFKTLNVGYYHFLKINCKWFHIVDVFINIITLYLIVAHNKI